MASEFQQSKFRHLFKVFDYDGNGFVDESDFLQQVDRLAEIRGLSIDSEVVQTQHQQLHFWWEQFKGPIDVDHDGHLSENEIVNFFSMLCDQAAVEAENGETNIIDMVHNSTKITFAVLDSNGSGAVSLTEFKDYLSSWNINTDSEACFQSMDTNGDGVLTEEETIDAATNFFLSDDPDAPGTLLYGTFME